MSKCPRCLGPLPAKQAWMCTSGRCAPASDAPPGVIGPVRITDPPADSALAPVGSVDCVSCRGATVEVCPTPECRFALPPDWRRTPATCIVLAGARGTGKSMYIAVLVKQLEQFGDLNGIRIAPATRSSAELYSSTYEKPLFEQRGILPPTAPASNAGAYQNEPLILHLAYRTGARHHLVLRDVAGEDLEAASPDVQNLRFVADADGVLFLFDPLSLPAVRSHLVGLVPTPTTSVAGASSGVLENVLRLLSGRRPRLAVALSKFDAMQAMRDVQGGELSRIMQNTGAAFVREPSWRGPYPEQDGLLLHEEIRSLLHRLGVGWLTHAVEVLGVGHGIEHRFFAVSALGDAPDGAHLHDRGIAPFRCLDPIRWILADRTN